MPAEKSQVTAPVIKVPDETAAAVEEVLAPELVETLNKVQPHQLEGAKPRDEQVKGTAYPSSGWLHAPGHLELLAVADDRLTAVGNQAGIPGHLMKRVEAKLVPGTKLLILKAAPESDLTKIPVNRYSGQTSAWINLYELLGPENLTVETGYRELYAVSYVPKSSPLWPALVIDLAKSKGRKQEPKRKKKAEGGESK